MLDEDKAKDFLDSITPEDEEQARLGAELAAQDLESYQRLTEQLPQIQEAITTYSELAAEHSEDFAQIMEAMEKALSGKPELLNRFKTWWNNFADANGRGVMALSAAMQAYETLHTMMAINFSSLQTMYQSLIARFPKEMAGMVNTIAAEAEARAQADNLEQKSDEGGN